MAMHSSILLIDDSPGERELFRLALKQTGLDVTLFTEQDAEAAFRFLEEQAKVQAETEWKHTDSIKPGSPTSSPTLTFPPLPSLILLDLHLGGQNGCDLLKRLRTDARFATIPVVVFTTSDDASDLSLAYANGANGYVVKPGTFAELIQCTTDICRYWLNRNRVPQMIGTPC